MAGEPVGDPGRTDLHDRLLFARREGYKSAGFLCRSMSCPISPAKPFHELVHTPRPFSNIMAATAPKTELGRLRILSPTASVRVSPFCLGGMSIGSAWSQGLGHSDKDAAFKLLDAFVGRGGNFIECVRFSDAPCSLPTLACRMQYGQQLPRTRV